jgi:assimilatory nitrate reductase catalytic subunit
LPVAALGRLLLIPSAKPPQNFKERGRVVCNCFNVAETEIGDALSQSGLAMPDTALAMLQQKLKCGTNCGSCVPELKKIVFSHCATAKAA